MSPLLIRSAAFALDIAQSYRFAAKQVPPSSKIELIAASSFFRCASSIAAASTFIIRIASSLLALDSVADFSAVAGGKGRCFATGLGSDAVVGTVSGSGVVIGNGLGTGEAIGTGEVLFSGVDGFVK